MMVGLITVTVKTIKILSLASDVVPHRKWQNIYFRIRNAVNI